MWIAFALLCVLLILGGVGFYLLKAPACEVPLAGGTLAHRQLPQGERVRQYDTYVANELVPDSPLVIVLHGGRQSPAGIRSLIGRALEQQARVCGFALAYPAAAEGYWNDGLIQAHYRARVELTDDVAFIEQLILAMVAEHAVDPQRVYVLGYGNGGQMACRLALEIAPQLAGVAMIAASLGAEDNLRVTPSGVAVPLMLVNGTADRLVPFSGGQAGLAGFRRRGAVRSAQETAQYFAALAEAPLQSNEAGSLFEAPALAPMRSAWRTAEGDDAVVLYAIKGGGHVLHQPHARQPRWLGAMNPGFDVAARACEFWRL